VSRQHTAPILFHPGSTQGQTLPKVPPGPESDLRDLILAHPEALPLTEIDAGFAGALPLCTEMATPAGPVDLVLLTPDGLPVLVECKLWRNPQARREVVGQVLDYAKELARWSSADIAREARRRGAGAVFDRIARSGPEGDEAAFHDSLTRNLRRGRCLLLIVGDGIREGVEAIFEHLRGHGALQFGLGLVEMPLYRLPDGGLLALPRVLARTTVEVRQVVELPEGLTLAGENTAEPPANQPRSSDNRQFWTEFLDRLTLDDPDQPLPSSIRQGYMTLPLPIDDGSAWLTVYRIAARERLGVYLSWWKGTAGERAAQTVIAGWSDELRAALGPDGRLGRRADGTETLIARRDFGDLGDMTRRDEAMAWLAAQTNTFVNVLRPAIRAAALDMDETGS